MMPDEAIDNLREAIEMACQSQNANRIVAGRARVLAMPRLWILDQVERVAIETLALSDYREYRRLLELAEMLDPRLVQRFVALGIDSDDPNVREAAKDFDKKADSN